MQFDVGRNSIIEIPSYLFVRIWMGSFVLKFKFM
jgi:hypothetical protein